MNTKLKGMTVAIAMFGFTLSAQAQTVSDGGPQADPYWRQFAPKQDTVLVVADSGGGIEADAYWSQFLPKHEEATVLADAVDGPTVDSYWSQFVPTEEGV